MRFTIVSVLFLAASTLAFAEGSKNVTPSSSGNANGENTFIGYLQHDDGTNSGNFFKPEASESERVYAYIRDGEVLYYGFRRRQTNSGGTFGDLVVTIRNAAGVLVQRDTIFANQSSTGNVLLQTGQNGVIESYAEAAAGPAAIVGGSGYNAISFENTTGVNQDFYVEVYQINVNNPATRIDRKSWYDLWDFSVFNGSNEETGRLHAKSWSFTSGSGGARLSTEFQFFALIDGVGADGFYVKEIDVSGIQPFGMLIYANSTGADPALAGTTNFLELRKSQTTNIASAEYDIFFTNPDIDIYPTATLPEVTISNFNTLCNADGSASAVVSFESNLPGIISLIVDLNGTPGFQDGTRDVILETKVAAGVAQSLIWNGKDGLGTTIPSGTTLSITGRYSAGPLHIPLWDAENNDAGVTISDVRPATSFDFIYWDDTNLPGNTFTPPTELNGSGTDVHDWGSNQGNNELVNTWSFGFFQLNSQTVNFTYNCDLDGDGAANSFDVDNDNDGIPDANEGDVKLDTDSDGIPDYLDADAPGFVDVNNDGVNDAFDGDLDGIPNAYDLDSDNDGIPDVIENGGVDANNDGRSDTALEFYTEAEDATVGSTFQTNSDLPSAFGGEYVQVTPGNTSEGGLPSTTAADRVRFTVNVVKPGNYKLQARVGAPNSGDDSFWVVIDGNTGSPIQFNGLITTAAGEFVFDVLHSDVVNPFTDILLNFTAGSHTVDFYYREDGTLLDALYFNFADATVIRDTDQDGVPDYQDLDSDNDGIVDVIEAGGVADVSTGRISGFTDSDDDGRNDSEQIFPLTIPDTDADGILMDYRDIDTDNDGIPDNREGQSSSGYLAPGSFVDSNDNGLIDTYDPAVGGNIISPTNTDGTTLPDYQDSDADDDGIPDSIEGFDANSNGRADWDVVGSNNSINDEVGFNVDSDTDGLWDIFDTEASGAAAGIGNVTSSNAALQNSDNGDLADWQDNDDDNDGILTSGEDTNLNGDFSDDKTQGQSGPSAAPNYLFNGDYDEDGVANVADLDSDNDGILDVNEDGNTGIDPSADADADGIPNFEDANITDFTDVNGDGVDDRMDADLDGVPNFLDVDSDNDGIYDALEANNGVIPNSFDTIRGQLTLDDPDNDGLMNQVDNNTIINGGASNLPKDDFDSDGIDDFLDIDSDNDGIPDIIEYQSEGGFVAPSGDDADGDGIDDAFDPSQGGTALTAINTDGTGEPDFRDFDSDDDNVLDIVEGNDSDNNGFGDWDANANGVADDAGLASDTDNDGLLDAFDTESDVSAVGNVTGSNAAIQNTDGLDNRNWRDNNDDNDSDQTKNEDANLDGNYSNDRTDGQGLGSNIPDYLFKGDTDGDLVADASDTDSDNDGVPDLSEQGGLGVDPSLDADSDGIPNYRDSDLPGFVDTNGDGVNDLGDKDLDGVPDFQDLDSDNDGIPDAVEANNGVLPSNMAENGQYPASYVTVPANDPDGDGSPLDIDPDDGGTALANLDHDGDGIKDFLDLDSDNDGIPDQIEGGGTDTNGDGRIDGFTDANNNGISAAVDPDEGGSAFSYPKSDSDPLNDYFDTDADNDGIADATEQGGRDTDANGRIDDFADTDADGLSDNVDSDNGGTALVLTDGDGDGLGNYRDLDSDNDGLPDIIEGGGTDADANGRVDGTFADANNNGYDDGVESAPFAVLDTDNDGHPDFADLDADNDGIVDPIEFGQLAGGNGQISGFTDNNNNGLNDSQEGSAISPANFDSDPFPNHLDIDSDNDGIVDNVEAQTRATYTPLSNTDADGDGLDDVYDTDNGGTLISPTNTDSNGNPDYIDTDSDDDSILDRVEGHDGNRNGIGDWDADGDGNLDDPGFDKDLDEDGLLDIFDTFGGLGNNNVVGSESALQDTDNDGISDFQDVDDDGDGVNTGTSTETNTFTDDPDGSIPNYLFDTKDDDGDSVLNTADLDSDNDGILDTDEDGGIGVDPSADADGDGLLNYEDKNDVNLSGFSDTNADGIDDRFDHDLDGVPDFLDLDSDNDGIFDAIEANSGVLPASGFTLANGNFDPANDTDGDGLANSVDATPAVSGGTSTLANPNSDTDGLADYLDLDSDNDGISDNREAQTSGAYIGLAAGDTDNDGVLDVYDGNNGGTSLTPVNSDILLADYIDPDSDGDGLSDLIEGHDNNSNAFADWDTDGDNNITDEVGFNVDADVDGIWDIFDTNNESKGISNVDGTNSPRQNTDGDANQDYRDGDDDGDGIATNLEDVNTNGDYTDDVTQGGGNLPNYLFFPDQDGDNVLDNADGDSDNDGIPNTSEYTGATYAASGTPFDDADGDGIFNYLDNNDVNNPSFVDVNGDGIDDQVDQDFDGVPNFFDLDSDNDGILDAIEANGGTSPAGFNKTTGRFTSTTDNDSDGVTDDTDPDDNDAGNTGTTLTVPNFDSDPLADYLDIDSDDDGITDNQEAISETRLEPTGTDANSDGLDDAYAGVNALVPENTDGTGEPDYRDIDSDDDTALDRVEGHDVNINGFADWDTGQDDNDNSTETGFNTDEDHDGLSDLFDNYTGFGINNINGIKANLQDTDSNGTRDWRDTDDDGDGVLTKDEDFNTNGILFDDKNQGGGAGPDYLFFADKDADGVADNISFDGDNDGIPNSVEIGALQNPYNDGDSDGIPAFQDSSEAGFIDSNSDGVDDRYDIDLDTQPDFLDLDSDNDGIPDAVEANGGTRPSGQNTEGQYTPVYTAANDANHNGLVDDVEATQGGTPLAVPDSDGDGMVDYKDLDSDNDGIADLVEAGGLDANNDGRIDAFGDTDDDGLANSIDVDNGGTPLPVEDLDGDNLPNYIDTDADNDGLSDLTETGGTDLTNDGVADLSTDTDADGWVDLFDSDNGGTALSPSDNDNDGKDNYLDLDSDNDGIPDAIERNGGTLPANMDANGKFSSFSDTDGDGLANDTDGTSPSVASTDADPIPDYLDIDSDNDGIPDILEVNGVDTDNNGRADGLTDTDGDGLLDLFDSDNGGTALNIANSDADGSLPDYRDRDADNDGIPDIVEVHGTDADNDGLPANPTTDSDGDGWSNTFDPTNGGTPLTVVDIDGDGLFNFQDLDADNDGLSDIQEVNGSDADADGLPASTVDTDGDGWPNSFDSDNGGVAYTYSDKDTDGRFNFADLDSDNDGIPDAIEANRGQLPANMSSEGQFSVFNDGDGDGLSNDRDSDQGGSALTPPNSDSPADAIADYLDLDSDNDGIPDAVEANGGTLPANMDANGKFNTFIDTDLDGLADGIDPDNGGTALANPNSDNGLPGGDANLPDYLDRDSDADGIVDIVEAGGVDSDHNGVLDAFADADGDGLGNAVDPNFGGGTALAYTDTDNDGTPNYADTDSDNDNVSDLIEAFDSNATATTSGGTSDGTSEVTPTGIDTDGDGIDNAFEGAIPTFQNTDSSGAPDWLDNDDDDDGIPTSDENADIDPSNGIPDYLEPTTNLCGANSVQLYPVDANITPVSGLVEADTDPAIGIPDGLANGTNAVAMYADNDEFQIDLQHFMAAGTGTYAVTWKRRAGSGTTAALIIRESADGISFTDRTVFPNTTDDAGYITSVFTPEVNTRFIRLEKNEIVQGDADLEVDAVGVCNTDQDNDLIADRNDIDDDNDGIPDALEISAFANDPSADDDLDGIPNYLDPDIAGYVDANTDNVNDLFDQDLDGVPDHLDLDGDNDGLPDALEANGGILPTNMTTDGRYLSSYVITNDTDRDGLANDVDPTDGGTALSTPDSDGDGNADFHDKDSDNDGIADVVEAGGTDADHDGEVDGGSDANSDGLISTIDSREGGTALTVGNADGDNLPNYRDADSDNDGIADIVEAGGTDVNGDGTVDTATDTDGDGWANIFDSDNGGTELANEDSDSDGLANFIDRDADNDGLPDALEANNGVLPANMDADGKYSAAYLNANDTDGDGLANDVDTNNSGTALALSNTDGIGKPDYLDIDADNDGIPDVIEAGGTDANNDGRLDSTTDSDNDGILDTVDPDNGGTAFTLGNPDGDGIPSYRDLDSDNDGIPDVVEVGGNDTNGDGLADNSSDNDGDGWSNSFDADNGGTAFSQFDTDGDGVPNTEDLDADNDGVADAYEANGGTLPPGMNADGQFIALVDGDGDGLHNNVDTNNGGTALPLGNTDGVGNRDFSDRESDGDGIPDYIEAFDDDDDGNSLNDFVARAAAYEAANGNPGHYTTTDSDSDGIPDWLEDDDSDGTANYLDFGHPTYRDSDGDGLVDLHDKDANGVAYGAVSGQPDADGDGNPNIYDSGDATALPVELTFLKGWYEDGSIQLTWETASEAGNDYFEVQRATDGKEFVSIGVVKGQGYSVAPFQYSYEDREIPQGTLYYRLHQVDFDGVSDYSGVVVVEVPFRDIRYSVYPNPTKGIINISFDGNPEWLELKLVDVQGRVRKTKRHEPFGSESSLAWSVQDLTQGQYLLQIISPNGAYSQRVLIIK